jgi:diguanylate cyclase (GGDEF)-like protein/PAS domain S-box-containing protein
MARIGSGPGTAGLLRALVLSVAAAAVPVAGAFLFPADLKDYEALTWLLLLVPAFLWAYERGWRGIATALAFGMAALSITYAVTQSLGSQLPPLLPPVLLAWLAVSIGIGLLRDGVSRAQYAAAAETLALQDPLTGLANRKRAELHLDLQFASAERGQPLAIVLFDIDHLSAYNLRNGRAAGDGVLKAFATLLRQQTRRMDVAARYGTDEFMVVLGGATEEGAVIFAARVQEHMRAAEQTVAVPTVSVGIATYRASTDSPDQLIREAEEALRLAKADGCDRVRIHGRRLEDLSEPVAQALVDSAPVRNTPALTGSAADAMGTGRAALVLTRDAIARARIGQILRRQGFEVAQAAQPHDVVASLRQEYDIVFVDVVSQSAPVAELISDLRYRAPATRVIGISPPDGEVLTPEMLRTRVDGHYVVADDESAVLARVRELLVEHDELAEAQLRHHQLSHELRSRDRELRQALAASEARFNALVQVMSDVVFTTDDHARWTSLNPAWTALTGLAVDSSLGRPLLEFVHPEDRAEASRCIERLRGGETHWQQELRWHSGEHGWRTVQLRVDAVRGEDGTLRGTSGLVMAMSRNMAQPIAS